MVVDEYIPYLYPGSQHCAPEPLAPEHLRVPAPAGFESLVIEEDHQRRIPLEGSVCQAGVSTASPLDCEQNAMPSLERKSGISCPSGQDCEQFVS